MPVISFPWYMPGMESYRRRFARICSQLQLEEGTSTTISQAYRQRLDQQWTYLQNLVRQLNFFANALVFDGQEMGLLREQLEHLAQFVPRRTAPQKCRKTVDLLGNGDGHFIPLSAEDVLVEAAAMGAYALAQTAVQDSNRRTQLETAFAAFINAQKAISAAYKKPLIASRKKVDKLYQATREQVLAAGRKKKNKATTSPWTRPAQRHPIPPNSVCPDRRRRLESYPGRQCLSAWPA